MNSCLMRYWSTNVSTRNDHREIDAGLPEGVVTDEGGERGSAPGTSRMNGALPYFGSVG